MTQKAIKTELLLLDRGGGRGGEQGGRRKGFGGREVRNWRLLKTTNGTEFQKQPPTLSHSLKT